MLSCSNSPIVELRFSIHPMADNFIEIIKGALSEAETSNVWMHTNDVSTIMRGKKSHLFDTAKAIALHASKTGVHIAFNGTFSIGCPGDSSKDGASDLDDHLLNEPIIKDLRQYVSAQFALYPMNNPDYMSVIYKEVDRAKAHSVYNENMQYASGLHGDIHDVFAFLEETFSKAYSDAHPHLVMTLNMSINSPSHTKDT